jgi:hypothetical protein
VVIVDPFKPASLILSKIDKDSGKALSGAVINIAVDTVGADGKHGPGKKVVTVTTGPDGTATAKLDVLLKAGTTYWATEVKAPTGYELDTTPQRFTAKPAARIEVTIADTKTPTTSPPTSPPAAVPPHAPMGQLAHTGGGNITWALGAGAVLLAGGGGDGLGHPAPQAHRPSCLLRPGTPRCPCPTATVDEQEHHAAAAPEPCPTGADPSTAGGGGLQQPARGRLFNDEVAFPSGTQDRYLR